MNATSKPGCEVTKIHGEKSRKFVLLEELSLGYNKVHMTEQGTLTL